MKLWFSLMMHPIRKLLGQCLICWSKEFVYLCFDSTLLYLSYKHIKQSFFNVYYNVYSHVYWDTLSEMFIIMFIPMFIRTTCVQCLLVCIPIFIWTPCLQCLLECIFPCLFGHPVCNVYYSVYSHVYLDTLSAMFIKVYIPMFIGTSLVSLGVPFLGGTPKSPWT